jgi:adenosine deaminase
MNNDRPILITPKIDDLDLTELHTHVGFCVSPTMLWEMAHNQGILLPTKDFWEFQKLVTIRRAKPYEEYLKMYDLTEKIQSSPEAMFEATKIAVSRAYRKTKTTKIELRFNPILRNRQGERDLDHIIVFTLQGLERAMLMYPVKAGIILMMDRRFSFKENQAVVKKAIKYKDRGVVGIDLAGPIERNDNAKAFHPRDIESLVIEAREAGLGVTVHTGEATNIDEMWAVTNHLNPTRIGHGIACVNDKKLMKYLAENKIVLETCPTSNLNTKLVKDFDHMREIYQTLKANKVLFTINTDGPEMQQINLRSEMKMLIDNNILDENDLIEANKIATKSSFIK